MSNFQGFNINVYAIPGGRITSYRRVKLSLGQASEAKNGYDIYKRGQGSGEIEGKGKLIFDLLRPLAVLGGSWQKIKPLVGMAYAIPDDEGGEPLHFAMESVVIRLPQDFEFNKLEGSEDNFTFPFDVLGQIYVGGLKVYEFLDEHGI